MIILETERLLFREHEIADLEPFCTMEADPAFRRYVGDKPRTRAQAEHKFRTVCLPPRRNRLGLWATVFKPDGRYIGYCGIYGNGPREGVLGYYIARQYWGQGLATEAARAFVDFGFRELNLSRIVSSVEAGNEASIRILQKLGFVCVRHEGSNLRSFDHFELRSPEGRH